MRVQQLKTVLIISVACILGAGAWQQAAFGQNQRNWRDRAEYDLYNAFVRESNPQRKLDLLLSWKEKYPETDWEHERLEAFVGTYSELKQPQKVANAAKELLAVEPKNLFALYQLTIVSPTLGDSPQVLADAEMAAKGVLANLDSRTRPATLSGADWNEARHNMEAAANTTLDWVYNKRKEYEEAVTAQAGTLSGKVAGVKGSSVVYIEAIVDKTFPLPAEHVIMDHKSLLFQPHILVVPVGTTVDFLNSDKVAHNIFWPAISGDKRMSHNLGTWPSGEKRSFKFDTPGVVPLLCNMHPATAAYVIVVPTPYHAETDADGNYKIQNLPDGSYTVSVWHEGMKVQSKPVTVAGEAKMDFSLANATEHVQLQEGQTPEEVEKILGKPDDRTEFRNSLVYTYQSVKVFFENGKLVDVQQRKK